MVFTCDGTSQTVIVTAVADPKTSGFHPGPAVVSVFARAMAGIPCPDRPLCFGFIDTQSTTVTSAVIVRSSNSVPETGARIGVFPAEQSFPANTPFHVTHGFFCAVPDELKTCMSARTHFDLFVNGVQQKSVVDVDIIDGNPTVLRKFNLTNYPNGLPAGTYTFTGQFFEDGQLTLTRTSIVHFV
jgi:hypothetical protein